ncbi:MAG: putative toxin-antitoxin system toxin component, PIN family [Anaerolineae bacterium]|nr:putative toxin-antitoxin system toxin component, PIN family [Anaerolineae bacterium]
MTPQHSLDVVPDDPDDNKFIECALEGRANFIVTRDSDLLRLNQYQSIEIVDDEAFLAVIVK